MKDEIINETDVVVSPRGRKAELDPELVELLKSVKSGQAIRLASYFGPVAKEDRSRVSQSLRKHWRAGRTDDIRIDYTPEGIPQVRVKAKRK